MVTNKNLIGISGRISSGKDLTAIITQYLFLKETLASRNMELFGKADHFNIFNNWSLKEKARYSGWEVNRFANKLKLIVSLLTGIPREDLEKEEVKNSFLGKEWDSWWYTNGVGDKFFASSEQEARMEHSRDYGFEKLTVRSFLQKLGTQGLRDVIHPNIHVNALFADYIGVESSEVRGTHLKHTALTTYPKWIIPDLRFPNEFEAIKERGGLTIRLERAYDRSDPKFNHSSETGLNWYVEHDKFDYVISNNGTIEQLIEGVKLILTKEGII